MTSHWTKATAAMVRKTVIGARRRKTRGKISAAANHGLGRLAVSITQARAEDEQARGERDVDQGGVAAVEGAQPLPDPPRPVEPRLRRPRRRGAPCAPGPEPIRVQVT